jgi:excisionase family DNA binding protein
MNVGYVTIQGAAEYASVSPRTVKRWIARGLPVYQGSPRGKVLIRPGDVDVYLEKKAVPRLDLDAAASAVMRDLAAKQAV